MILRLFLILSFAISAWADPLRFQIKDLTQRNLMAFISEAPLEKMIAQCHLLRGWIELDPQSLELGIKGELELDVRSCETGSGIRDLLLQEKIWEVKNYPTANVTIKKWVKETKGSLSEKSDQSHLVALSINYHDKAVTLEAPLKLTYFGESEKTRSRLPGNLLRISSELVLPLSEVGISIPDELKSTLSSKVAVVFDAVGTSKLPNDKILLPEGPKPKERS
jgi:hypothetical protein